MMCWCAKVRQDFAEAISSLLSDDACAGVLASSGRETFLRNWSRSHAEADIAAIQCAGLLCSGKIRMTELVDIELSA